MMTDQVPETIGGSIPASAVEDAARESGMMPQKLPEWEPPSPVDTLTVTPVVKIRIEHHAISALAKLLAPMFIDIRCTAPRAEALRFYLAELEKALPILRALVNENSRKEVDDE